MLETSDVEPLIPTRRKQKSTYKIWMLIFCLVALIALVVAVVLLVNKNNNNLSPVNQTHSSAYWQQRLLTIPTNNSVYNLSKALASKPHIAGTNGSETSAETIASMLVSLGFSVTKKWIHKMVLSKFVSSSLTVCINNTNITIDISNDVIKSDAQTNTSFRHSSWFAYGASGNVSGKLIYLNDVSEADLQAIEAVNPNITWSDYIGVGKYGSRVKQAIVAGNHSLQGLILFHDQVLNKSDAYPNGPELPDSGFMYSSVRGATGCAGPIDLDRLVKECAFPNDTAKWQELFPSMYYELPMISIGAKEGKELMDLMSNVAGGCQLNEPAYFNESNFDIFDVCMDSAFTAFLNTQNEFDTNASISNVFGYINGSVYPDEIVMIGAHRDAWGYGAQDDVSGTVTMLEVAKTIAQLQKEGWKPKRSLLLASWDGEEWGLFGSVHFNEDEQNVWMDKIVSYTNLDMTVGMPTNDSLRISGHPLQDELLKKAAKEVTYPYAKESNYTFYENFFDAQNRSIEYPNEVNTDHAAFLFHNAIPSINTRFEKGTQAYHTFYDTNGWVSVIDPDWDVAKQIAEYTALTTFLLLDSEVLPFNVSDLHSKMESFIGVLEDYAAQHGCNITDGAKLQLLESALVELGKSAGQFEQQVYKLQSEKDSDSSDESRRGAGRRRMATMNRNEAIEAINMALQNTTRLMVYQEGMQSNPWFRNIILGNGNSRFPLIYDSIPRCNSTELEVAFNVTSDRVLQMCDNLDNASNAVSMYQAI